MYCNTVLVVFITSNLVRVSDGVLFRNLAARKCNTICVKAVMNRLKSLCQIWFELLWTEMIWFNFRRPVQNTAGYNLKTTKMFRTNFPLLINLLGLPNIINEHFQPEFQVLSSVSDLNFISSFSALSLLVAENK